jgi:hypothetical protein
MQERRLRLGDVLDDYCPREKRLSNHAIVALVGDEVRTTRCSTCDFEHVYKGGKVPARRKKADPQAVLYKTVLENITGRDTETGAPLQAAADAEVPQAPAVAPVAAAPRLTPAAPQAPPVAVLPPDVADTPPPEDAEPKREEPVHRHTLIRATLPKIEGQVQERKPADFTSYARPTPGRRFGGGGGGGRPRQPQAAGNTSWGGYSPYANGHPSGKGPQQGHGGQPGKSQSRPNNRRGR